MQRVDVEPTLLRWARERAGISIEDLIRRFPKYAEWEAGQVQPTFKRLKKFANVTYAPFGSLFRLEPLVEDLEIPDFRTIGDKPLHRPSPNFINTLDLCIHRQDCYHEYALTNDEDPVALVGCATLQDSIEQTAEEIRAKLKIESTIGSLSKTWTDAICQFTRIVEDAGILVRISGIVASNTSRKMDPTEFRGFALSDGYAPVVFVNGADSKAAQMFTLAHEIAHLALGQSALSDMTLTASPEHEVKSWCNQVAAEVLVPLYICAAREVECLSSLEMLRQVKARFVSGGSN